MARPEEAEMQNTMWNPLLINGVMIDWNRISSESYLRDIPAINGVEQISFRKPVTFFVGENGVVLPDVGLCARAKKARI